MRNNIMCIKQRILLPIYVCLGLIWLVSYVEAAPVSIKKKNNSTTQQRFEHLVRVWQSIFGPVDFAKHDLFQVMLYAWPQKIESMTPFVDEKLSSSVIDTNIIWMNNIFRKEVRPDLKRINPTHYFFGGKYEPDLLMYDLEVEDTSYYMLDNASMILLTPKIQSSTFKKLKSVPRKELSNLLLKFFNLPYRNAEEVVSSFKLPSVLKIGDVFTNSDRIIPQVAKNWQDHVVGFIGKSGITIICFKASYSKSQQESAAIYSFTPSIHWLEGNLFKSDGTVILKTTKIK